MSFFRIYWRVFALLRTEQRTVALLIVGAIGLVGTQFAEPILLGRLINKLTEGAATKTPPRFDDLMPLIAAWIGFALASIGAAVLVSLFADRLAHRRRLATMALFFEHALELPLSFHSTTHSGRSLKIMIESSTAIFWFYLSLFRENLGALLSLVVVLPMALWFNWRLGMLLVVLVFVSAGVATFVRRRTETLQLEVEGYNTSLAEHAADVLSNVPVIQSFTRVTGETDSMRVLSRALLDAQMPVLSWWALAVVFGRAASTITLLLIFISGTVLYLHGIGTIGGIVMFMSFAGLLIGKLEQVVGFSNSLFQQSVKLNDFFKVLDTVPHVADKPGATDPGKLQGRVVFEHVGFAYPATDDQPMRRAVDDLHFVAEPGETIALVGATGSGKSTTMALLHRAFDPQAGRITIDGIDIRDLPLDALRRNIGVVFQEPMLFARSIEENLRIGKPDATPAEIALALERAQAADFVARQPQGLATPVGERGRSLSGGERQRVAIARALLACPRLLLFDEPLASLDRTRKLEILPLIERLRDEFVVPIVYVTHAMEEVARLAAHVVVLEDGKVTASGDPARVFGPSSRPQEPRFGRVSLLDVTVGASDVAYGLTALDHPAGTLWLAGPAGAPGRRVRALIHATDVSLAPAPPGPISIRSALAGTVAGIVDEGPLAEVELALDGGGALVALVTRKAVEDLGLRRGSNVQALIKTVALDEASIPRG